MNLKRIIKKIGTGLFLVIKKLKLNKIIFKIMKPFSHKKVKFSSSEAEKILNDFSPLPEGSSIKENSEKAEEKYDLQIIIPAYNAEKYLRKCLDSVVNQKTDFSFLTVVADDGSTDSTGKIADEYAEKYNVKVIHGDNKGVSEARNAALKKIEARYVTFVDSDDRISENYVQTLLNAAIENNADIVQSGIVSYEQGSTRTIKKYEKTQIIKPEDIPGFACSRIYKKCLWEKVKFPPGFWFEDTINSFIVYPHSEKAVGVPGCTYYYTVNYNGASRTVSDKSKCIDTFYITRLLSYEREKAGLHPDEKFIDRLLTQAMLNRKRIAKTPEKVRESVFVLTKELILGYNIPCTKNKELYEAFKNDDYGIYNLYCKLL